MNHRDHKVFRFISTIILSLFCWTFTGFYDIAHAVQGGFENQSSSAPATQTSSASELQALLDKVQSILDDKSLSKKENKTALRGIRKEALSIDKDIRKEFRATEEKVKKIDSLEILKRHRKFVRHYNLNLQKLLKNIEEIDVVTDDFEFDIKIKQARRHLNDVKPPKRHRKLDPDNLPHQMPDIVTPENLEVGPKKIASIREHEDNWTRLAKKAANDEHKRVLVATLGSVAGLLSAAAVSATPPTQAALSETPEVKFTPEIVELAESLDKHPVRIYEWVRNNIVYEPYYGSLKGAHQTLLERAGNDMDQASLLISLFRASGVPARYVSGEVEMSIERLMNWLGGITDKATAVQILATNGVPVVALTSGGEIAGARFEHTWVEAYVDMYPYMGGAPMGLKDWTPLSTGIKEMVINPDSINLTAHVPFDEMGYLTSGDKMMPVVSYINTLKTYYDNTYGEYGLVSKFSHAAVIKPTELKAFAGTLQARVINRNRYAAIYASKRHTVSFGLYSTAIDQTNMSPVSLTLSEIAGKKITITYEAAEPSDTALIESYGGFLNTPSYLVNVKPTIKVEGDVVYEGPVVHPGAEMYLRTEVHMPNLSVKTSEADISDRLYMAIAIGALEYPGKQLFDELQRLDGIEGTVVDSINVMDARAGELLYNIGVHYLGKVNNSSRLIEYIMHVQNTRRPSVVYTSCDVTYNYMFGVAMSAPEFETLSMDAVLLMYSPFSVDGDMGQRHAFARHRGLNSSYLEHKVTENLLDIEAVSAVKALQIAASEGQHIYTIDKENAQSVYPNLTFSAGDMAVIREAVDNGQTVTVSEGTVTYYDRTGFGYIVRDEAKGTGAYMISEGLHGGEVVDCKKDGLTKKQCYVINIQPRNAYYTMGRPMWYEALGAVFGFLPYGVWVLEEHILGYYATNALASYGYSGYNIQNIDKAEEFARIARDSKTWILYYSGHGGTGTNPLTGLQTNYIAVNPDQGEVVWPELLTTGSSKYRPDIKLVVLNGCNMGNKTIPVNDLADAFGVYDNKWTYDRKNAKSIPRNEAFISWKSFEGLNVNNQFTSVSFGIHFWQDLLFKKQNGEHFSINGITMRYQSIFPEDGKYLTVEGNGNTTIRFFE